MVKAKKRLGQHFVFRKDILEQIVSVSGVTENDTVVEIGSGMGTLTQALAEKVSRVIALEIDRDMIKRMEKVLAKFSNVELIHADALKYNYELIGAPFKVVANIPYYLTTPLLFRLLEFRTDLMNMTLMVQQEVAQRIVAVPGNKSYGVLSITMQTQTVPKIMFTVPKEVFRPQPKVDSAIVFFDIPPTLPYIIKDYPLFVRIVRTAFSQRRKMLLNSLKALKISEKTIKDAGVAPDARPETLSINDFIRISEKFSFNHESF
jgi:16S rRNA (adenine1518-N6/adenine1519-N6)-dimethyltransferase